MQTKPMSCLTVTRVMTMATTTAMTTRGQPTAGCVFIFVQCACLVKAAAAGGKGSHRRHSGWGANCWVACPPACIPCVETQASSEGLPSPTSPAHAQPAHPCACRSTALRMSAPTTAIIMATGTLAMQMGKCNVQVVGGQGQFEACSPRHCSQPHSEKLPQAASNAAAWEM